MSKITTNLLFASIACIISGLALVTGLVNAEGMAGLYVALPLGASFFGLFLISRIFEKEVSQYDDEQQALTKGTVPVKEKEATATVIVSRPGESSSAAR